MQLIDYSHTISRIEIDKEEENKKETISPSFNVPKKYSRDDIFTSEKIKQESDNGKNDNRIDFFREYSTGVKFSNEYVEFNSAKFVKDLIDDFSYWLENGTEDSLFKIDEIKNKIYHYDRYLSAKEENDIFVNSVSLIMDNNCWVNISEGQIKSFIGELSRFIDGVIDWDKLKIFSKQVNRLKIEILSNEKEE